MKIGFSYSRCLLDIFNKKVDINEVLVIIARTRFDPLNDKHWDDIWHGYCSWNNVWHDYSDKYNEFRDITIKLQEYGKLHQPRMFGAQTFRSPYIWLDAILLPEDAENNLAVKEAWDHLKIVTGLANVKIERIL